jgi:hypothetical protein
MDYYVVVQAAAVLFRFYVTHFSLLPISASLPPTPYDR